MHNSIFVGVGANLTHERYGSPQQTLAAALEELCNRGVKTLRRSAWYRTAPVPASNQPWYVNAVAEVASCLPADALLAELHAVEAEFGRRRTVPNAARPIDLDLLDYHGGNRRARAGPGDPAASAHDRPGLRAAPAGRRGAGLAPSGHRRADREAIGGPAGGPSGGADNPLIRLRKSPISIAVLSFAASRV
jgi:2-amino-4-hydroxy-6-hydroxymethyldihydropteridine diphosphokinase